MHQIRILLLATFAILAAVSTGCRDRRPVWSIAPEAVETLTLDSGFETSTELPTEWPNPGCQQVLELGSDRTLPQNGLGPEDLRWWLGEAERVDLACVGEGQEGSTCLPHHNVKLVDAESAWTRCAAAPDDDPPCALAVEWDIGKKTQRSIIRIYCATTEVPISGCGLLFVRSSQGLQITCSLQANE